ncbi:hypothetical protein GJAV_G00089480 [Gymnothorax javanicus]|nr:hypothetical protein GJAV_G00089480 [Gymnothorax javanicus]
MSGEAARAQYGPDSRNADSKGYKSQNGQNAPAGPVDPRTQVPAPPPDPGEESASSLTDAAQMWIKFGKTFAFLFPIYVLGYFEFSFSWILIGLAAFFWWRKTKGNENRITKALAFLGEEEQTARQSVTTSDLPPWVHFPDVERVEWLNKTVKQMWPFICQFVEKIFRETIEPAVRGANPHLSTFCFSKIDMGDKPLRVNGVKVYTENVDKRQIIMDLQISFVGNTEIDCDIKKYYCRAGIKSIQLHGVARVIMEPLLGDMPLVGAVSVFFLKKPLLDINWTGLTNMLDIPGLNGLCDGLIQDIIYGYLVQPNKIDIPLVGPARMAQLSFPIPEGVLRIHFLEAQDLERKDKFLGGAIKGKSDPYGIIQIGNKLIKSKTKKESVNPKWNEVYEVMMHEHMEQPLKIELFDEDPDEDDFLGSVMIDMAEINKERKVDEWFTLEEVTTGKLHLKLEWLSVLPTPERLNEALMSIKADRGQANDGLSSAVLIIYLDSARNLPSGKKVTSEPSPMVKFTVGHKVCESKTRYKTDEPLWGEPFTFLIHNPKTQELEVEVWDEKHECSLGTLAVPLSRLLDEEDMTLDQRFFLKNSAPGCTLKMKMALRVLCLVEGGATDQLSSDQLRKAGGVTPGDPGLATPSDGLDPTLDSHLPNAPSNHSLQHLGGEEGPYSGSPGRLGDPSSSSPALSASHRNLAHNQSTPSIASDLSNPLATQELQQRLQQLQNGTAMSHFPLGEIQLTVRHSSQRNKLIVVVHGCRNLISFTDSGSDPYVRLYLLPDKRRSGRRKTSTLKKNLNPIYDQTFEFSVPLVELHRRTLDVAVKNGGGLLSKHKGLLGKVLVDFAYEDVTKGWTQWYELTGDGTRGTLDS